MMNFIAWLATDCDGICSIYHEEPYRGTARWFSDCYFLDVVNPNDFPDIELPTWEDDPVQIELCLDIKCVRKL